MDIFFLNRGQISANLKAEDALAIGSAFQVAGVSRLLMSVFRICDQGLLFTCDAKEARITNEEVEASARF